MASSQLLRLQGNLGTFLSWKWPKSVGCSHHGLLVKPCSFTTHRSRCHAPLLAHELQHVLPFDPWEKASHRRIAPPLLTQPVVRTRWVHAAALARPSSKHSSDLGAIRSVPSRTPQLRLCEMKTKGPKEPTKRSLKGSWFRGKLPPPPVLAFGHPFIRSQSAAEWSGLSGLF